MLIITSIIAGAAMAGGGWLFHHIVKEQTKLQMRLEVLESKARK